MRTSPVFVLYAAALLWAPPAARGKEPRNREWLVRHITQPAAGSPHAAQYLGLMNPVLDEKYLDLDLKFLENGGADLSRRQTASIGRLAFCYYTQGLKYYHDPRVLEKLRQAYVFAAAHIGIGGMFQWLGDTGYYFRPHEQAWRLEPLLLGYIWVGDKFPPQDRQVIEAALRRAAEWLVHNPTNETNNRGAVWCAVATLCGLYYDRPDYLEQVEKYAPRIINGAVWEDGETGEHGSRYGSGGPDSNYSYTGWSYVYLYRLLSGKDELDGRLLTSLRWFSLYNTLSGSPLVDGASVRKRRVQPGLCDLLPALEHYSRGEPFFAASADHIRTKLRPGFCNHTVSPLFWAMWEHGAAKPTTVEPSWRRNQTRLYERDNVQYALVSRHYQTGVVFRGRVHDGTEFPLRGMQTFAFGREEPILLNTNTGNSSIEADGIDTATSNVDKGPNGWEVFLAKGPELATITERRQTFWTVYAYTPDSAVVVSGSAHGPMTSRWLTNRTSGSPPLLNETQHAVAFAGRKGRIYYLAGRARLTPADVLEVVTNPPISACAFSNDTFRWGRYDAEAQILSFSDGSGEYRLSLKNVVRPDGTLDRNPAPRLAAR